MHMRMTKVISLSNKAYESLKKLKEEKDSFSDIVLKLINKEKKKSLLEFAGVWKNANEMDKIFERIFNERYRARDRNVDLKW